MTSNNINDGPQSLSLSSLKMRRKAAQKLSPLKIEPQVDSEASRTWDMTSRRYHSHDSGIETRANVGTSSDRYPSTKGSPIYPHTAGGPLRAVLIPSVALSPVFIPPASVEHPRLLARSIDRSSRSSEAARVVVITPPLLWSPGIYGSPTCLVPYPSYFCKPPVGNIKLPQDSNVPKRNGRKRRRKRKSGRFNKFNLKKTKKFRPQGSQEVYSVEIAHSFSLRPHWLSADNSGFCPVYINYLPSPAVLSRSPVPLPRF